MVGKENLALDQLPAMEIHHQRVDADVQAAAITIEQGHPDIEQRPAVRREHVMRHLRAYRLQLRLGARAEVQHRDAERRYVT